MALPYDPVILPLGIYTKESNVSYDRDTSIPMFTDALFRLAKLYNEPRCPSMGACIMKMWQIYTIKYYSAIKQNKKHVLGKIDGIRVDHVKQNKSDSGNQISYFFPLVYRI
jgi:hypothetical protein